VLYSLGHPKIANFNVAVAIQQDVLQLDVPMHDQVLMQVQNPLHYLPKEVF
jgi:hypothetical protein